MYSQEQADLISENASLRAEVMETFTENGRLAIENGELRAEVERLQHGWDEQIRVNAIEIERLRGALQEIVSYDGDHLSQICARTALARAALGDGK
jgi:regulator of replication initiation timing